MLLTGAAFLFVNILMHTLDAQYDIIEEAENAVEKIRSQIRDLRRNQISSESTVVTIDMTWRNIR